MKLEKAIRRLQRYVRYIKPNPHDNFVESVQLAIEASKELKKLRQTQKWAFCELLSGETKD